MEGLTEADRMSLHKASQHAFRHTSGIHTTAEDVPIGVIQRAPAPEHADDVDLRAGRAAPDGYRIWAVLHQQARR
jgi:hypothetical protein